MTVGCYHCVLTTAATLTTVPSQPSLIPGPDSRRVVFLSLLTFWVVFWEQFFWYSGDVLGLFAEEHDSEENEKRRKKKKGTKRKRDGRDQEERTLSCDLKLDDMLDRTLEDGAKQHNLTAVNVRNILHVSATGAVVYWEHREAKGNNSETLQSWYVNY